MRSDARERRRRIIDTACELWRTTNPGEVTLERIARQAGVGIATVYRNFTDRQDLAWAAALTLLERVAERQEDAMAHFAEDPRAAWDGYVHYLVDMGLGTLVPALAPEHLAELPDELDEVRVRARGNMRRMLELAHEHGLVPASLTPDQFITRLTVVSRPPVPGVCELDPGVTDELVEVLLEHGRMTAARDAR
ncbi:TetR/AcrR family transcriptional regulator [Corynebacterium frankenforstense]